jgi:23S rRNA maturation-related 3'-5' exoribonuclease YhaM
MFGLVIIRKIELKQFKKELREKDGIISNLEVQMTELSENVPQWVLKMEGQN